MMVNYTMKYLLFTVIVAACVASAWSYCYVNEPDHANKDKCIFPDGTELALGGNITFPEKCERCDCVAFNGPGGGTSLSCCGYGINVGVIAPPPGCQVGTEEDGCTMRLVDINDPTKDCLLE